MPTANKFAVLSDVNEKKKQLVVSDTAKPKKDKPKGEAAAKPAAKPAAAAAKAAPKAAKKGAAAAPASDAPTDLRAAAEFNRKKAEELAKKKAAEEEARAVAQRAAAEAAAVKEASEEAQAEVQGEADAAKEAADEAAAVAAEAAPAKKPVEEAPAKPVMTLADYNKARAESKFAIGAKQARAADAAALKSLQKVEGASDELVIKKAAEAKPVNTKAKKNVAPAPKLAKKEKAEKIDLTKFADFSAAPRGRGGYRGDGERGRGRGGADGERGRGRGGAEGEAPAAPAPAQE